MHPDFASSTPSIPTIGQSLRSAVNSRYHQWQRDTIFCDSERVKGIFYKVLSGASSSNFADNQERLIAECVELFLEQES